MPKEPEARDVMAVFDHDGDGYIVREELSETLASINPDRPAPSDGQVDDMLAQADTDNSGTAYQTSITSL